MYTSAVFCFFSGTGNSARAAMWAAEESRTRGTESRVLPIGDARPEDIPRGPGKLLGLFLPTHGFTAPWSVIRFVLGLPRGGGAHAFVMPTRGGTRVGPFLVPGMEGTAGWLPGLILLLKGYRLRGVMGLDMPANWTSFHWGMRPESIAMFTSRAEPKARRFTADILAGKTRIGGFIPLAIGTVLFPGSLVYLILARPFLAKLFFADNRCTGCGLCARICPRGAIRMFPSGRPRPYWTFGCETCMRCMAFCPEKAVQAGHSWGVILLFLVWSPSILLLFNRTIPGIPAEIAAPLWMRLVIEYVFILVSLGLAYFVFAMLIRIPAVNALFTWTTLTRFWRRYHEPDVTLTDLQKEAGTGRQTVE